MWDELARLVGSRANAEWLAALDRTDIPHAVLNDLEDLLDDPHLAATGFWRMLEHPTEGAVRLPANPIEMPASPPEIRRLPPRLREHTAEVLREHGFTEATSRDWLDKACSRGLYTSPACGRGRRVKRAG